MVNYENDVKNQIFNKCRELITNFCANEFWVGNYGNFDSLAANVVRKLKQSRPDVELILILKTLVDKDDRQKFRMSRQAPQDRLTPVEDG